MYVNIISLERFDEGLCHPIRLWRPDRREARYKADRLGEGDCLVSAVSAAVVREPFDRMRQDAIGKSTLHTLEHQISDHLAGDATGGGDLGHHLAITGVEREGDANALGRSSRRSRSRPRSHLRFGRIVMIWPS
jgi:hypothetical protein